MVTQDYGGDVDLYPRFRPSLLTALMLNPSRVDLAVFIREGERSVWPRLGMIRDQTRLGRVFQRCVEGVRGEG